MILSNGSKIHLTIRRLRCSNETCHLIHHELPDIIVPYKRHEALTIGYLILLPLNQTMLSHPCEISTIYRLRTWFSLLQKFIKENMECRKKLFILDIKLYHLLCHSHIPTSSINIYPDWIQQLIRFLVNNGHWRPYPLRVYIPPNTCYHT